MGEQEIDTRWEETLLCYENFFKAGKRAIYGDYIALKGQMAWKDEIVTGYPIEEKILRNFTIRTFIGPNERLCGDEKCYDMSLRMQQSCEAVYTEQEDFSALQKLHWFFLSAFLIWFVFICTDLYLIIEYTFIQRKRELKIKEKEVIKDTIHAAQVLFVIIFAAIMIPLYEPTMNPINFCRMNKHEPICQNRWNEYKNQIDCFTQSLQNDSNIEVYVDDIGGFLYASDQVKCTHTMESSHFMTQNYKFGAAGYQPHNFLKIDAENRLEQPLVMLPTQIVPYNKVWSWLD